MATNNSIRLRILKLSISSRHFLWKACYKQFDPVADTETLQATYCVVVCRCYKQFDPVADTETMNADGLQRPIKSYKQFDPVADTETISGSRGGLISWGYKQFDPVADTETRLLLTAGGKSVATNNSIRLRILKHNLITTSL